MYISVNKENYLEIKNEFNKKTNVLYGGGMSGRRFLRLFEKEQIKIKFIIDDDPNKWGTQIDGIPIISFFQLEKMSQKEQFNIIIASIYGNLIYRKLKILMNIDVFEMFAIYFAEYQDSEGELLTMCMDVELWRTKAYQLLELYNDPQSQKIVKVFLEVVEKTTKDFQKIAPFCSDEEHYFVKEILDLLKPDTTIVDCGAYTGDLFVQMEQYKIPFKKAYAFEVNPNIYSKLKQNLNKMRLMDKVVAIKKGVWNLEEKIYLNISSEMDTAGKLTEIKSDILTETVKLDDFFQNTSIDFLKMDIEGAELKALEGSEKILKRDRPLLAISVYHSLDDFVNIPLYLSGLLKDYSFFIRHHSLIFSETVLYGIPKELEKEAIENGFGRQ